MSENPELRDKLNRETARIPWADLQPHFARGSAVYVAPDLDLIDVAMLFAEDRSEAIHSLMAQQRVVLVTEVQAANWADQERSMWAVVVAPWVLVQPFSEH